MHRSSMLFVACAAVMASACTATVRGRATTGEPPPPEPVVRDHRHRHREPPPPPPPEPEVRDHRTERPPPPPVVRDHRDREPDYPTRGGWSTRGWTMLGEQWVSGKKDFIRVGAREGTFTKLMMVVEEGDLQLNDIIIEYDNGRKHSPRVAHFFKEGQRTQAIDLRGDARVIKRIELRYANVGTGRRAKVSIWGREG